MKLLTHAVDIDGSDLDEVLRCSWCGEQFAAVIRLSFPPYPDGEAPHIVFREGYFYDLNSQVFRMSGNAWHRMKRGEPSRKFKLPAESSVSRPFNHIDGEVAAITQKHDASRYELRYTPFTVMCDRCENGYSRVVSALALDTARSVRTLQTSR